MGFRAEIAVVMGMCCQQAQDTQEHLLSSKSLGAGAPSSPLGAL